MSYPSITRNECGRTNFDTLITMTLVQVQDHYANGRLNQSEYELYTHFWNKTQNKKCNCAFDLIEQGKSEELWAFVNEMNYTNSDDFFCVFGWAEGRYYCLSSKNYYDCTGFQGLQNNLKRMEEKINNMIAERNGKK